MISTTIDKLAEPGCYDGISGDWIHPNIYHASDRISRSPLVRILESPAAFKSGEMSHGRALYRGDCAHARVLEPDRFASEYAIAPSNVSQASKEGKAAWDSFTRSIGWVNGQPTDYARTIVGYDYAARRYYREDVATVQGIAAKLEQHPKMKAMLQGPGITEGTYCWDDQGTRLRVRPDRRIKLASGEWALIDFKTTADASEGEFSRSIAKYNYHFQAAMYLEGVSQATGIPHKRFLFLAAESSAPYSVQLYELDHPSIMRGLELYHRALDRLRACEATNHWPDDSGQMKRISVPSYALRD